MAALCSVIENKAAADLAVIDEGRLSAELDGKKEVPEVRAGYFGRANREIDGEI